MPPPSTGITPLYRCRTLCQRLLAVLRYIKQSSEPAHEVGSRRQERQDPVRKQCSAEADLPDNRHEQELSCGKLRRTIKKFWCGADVWLVCTTIVSPWRSVQACYDHTT